MSSSTMESTSLPPHIDTTLQMPSSPDRAPSRALSATSPRPVSPALSQIFERDVQEGPIPTSPAVPSHISTDNHIPPVLNASSAAITDGHLSPDSVEIVTHASHQPAAAILTRAPSMDNLSSTWDQDLQNLLQSVGDKDDSASIYGSLDASCDVKRLSFISFADLVQSEHAAAAHAGHQQPGSPHSRDSFHLAGLTSMSGNLSSVNIGKGSPPIVSPVSSPGLGPSPPTSQSGSIKGLEMSPSRRPLAPLPRSPTSYSHYTLSSAIGNEVNVETMTQALKRTGSPDFTRAASLPISPVEGGALL